MEGQINIQYHKSGFGELIIGTFDHQLCLCDWRYRKMRKEIDQRIKVGLNAEFLESEDKLIQETIEKLNEFERGKRQEFDIPLLMVGSSFQKKVWEELLKIKYGETISYMQLAVRLGNKQAIRAVASANGANAISILVPCHRIVGSQGELTGYAGGLQSKHKLLKLESSNSPGSQQMELFEL